MSTATSPLNLAKRTVSEYSEDKVPKLSAALAFYTMLSVAPLLIISMKVVSEVFKGPDAQQQVHSYMQEAAGPGAANAVREMVEKGQQKQTSGTIATIISVIVLLFSASGVFGELQDSLNTIWEVKPRPNRGIWGTIKERFFSMTLVLGVAFLLLVSLLLSTVLSAIQSRIMPNAGWLWKGIDFVVSMAVVAGLFALMFKYLPDVKVGWHPVLIGAAITAVLFAIGKFILAWYLGKQATTSVYGAAGSLVALLLWVYYSAQILFFGAEFTQVYAQARGEEIVPSRNAVRITEEDRVHRGAPRKGVVEGIAAERLDGPPWYPAVPARYEMAVAPQARQSAPSVAGAGGSKIVPLLIGVAVGKLLLGGKKKPKPRPATVKQFAPSRLVEPGWVSRRRIDEEQEYVLRVRPPEFMKTAARKARQGAEYFREKYREARRQMA